MIQSRIFQGTIAEVEQALNAWLASVPQGAQLTFTPLIVVAGTDQVIKEVLVNLPERRVNNRPPEIATPGRGF